MELYLGHRLTHVVRTLAARGCLLLGNGVSRPLSSDRLLGGTSPLICWVWSKPLVWWLVQLNPRCPSTTFNFRAFRGPCFEGHSRTGPWWWGRRPTRFCFHVSNFIHLAWSRYSFKFCLIWLYWYIFFGNMVFACTPSVLFCLCHVVFLFQAFFSGWCAHLHDCSQFCPSSMLSYDHSSSLCHLSARPVPHVALPLLSSFHLSLLRPPGEQGV